jgi:nucleotide-binding universal stress UspA family protein
MFKRILVPLDGSLRAERALPVAAHIARASGGSLVLLRVVNFPIEYGMYPTQPEVLTNASVDAEIAVATDYLTWVAQSDELAGIATEIEAISGAPASMLFSVAESSGADLIVMCSHGYTGLKRWMLGSVADKVTRYAPVPILVLREHGSVPGMPDPAISRPLRILVPLDSSPLSEAVLEAVTQLAAAMAAAGQCALHLLRVVDAPVTFGAWKSQVNISTEMIEQEEKRAEVYLTGMIRQMQESSAEGIKLSVTASVVTDADVAGAILKTAENTEDAGVSGVNDGYDLIAMSTHGRHGLERWAVGSITERVLHGTALPLFIVRPHGKAARPEKSEGEVIKKSGVEEGGWVGLL